HRRCSSFGRAIESFGDAAEIRVQRVTRGFGAQERTAVFGGENQMNVNGGQGLGHGGRMPQRGTGFQPNDATTPLRWVSNKTNRTTSTRLWPFVRGRESPQPHCGWKCLLDDDPG